MAVRLSTPDRDAGGVPQCQQALPEPDTPALAQPQSFLPTQPGERTVRKADKEASNTGQLCPSAWILNYYHSHRHRYL